MDINKEEDTKTSKNIGFASGLQSLSDALVALVEQASPSVVSLTSVVPDAGRRRWGRFGLGTGVVLSEEEGHIISNSHVVHRAQEAEVGLPSGETARAKVVGRDAESDLALLKLESKVGSLKSIQFGDSDQLKVGQFVIAVARAFGADPSATSGIITSSRRSIRGWGGQLFENVVVSDAQVNPGYSGSPLLDTSGNMVALNTAFAFSRALSIPANRVKEIAEKLKRDGRVRHAYLGVTLDPIPLPQDVARVSRSHEGRDYGLMVLSVSDESPAKTAGLAIGDVLMAFDEQQVSSYADLRKLLKENAIGKTAKISVLRGGKISDFEITPADDEQIAQ